MGSIEEDDFSHRGKLGEYARPGGQPAPGTAEHLKYLGELYDGGIGTHRDLQEYLDTNRAVESIALFVEKEGQALDRALPNRGILIGQRRSTSMEIRLWPGEDAEEYSKNSKGAPAGVTSWIKYRDPYDLVVYDVFANLPTNSEDGDIIAHFRAIILGAPDIDVRYEPGSQRQHPVMIARIVKGIAQQLASEKNQNAPGI